MLKIEPQKLFLASTKLPNRMRTYGYHNRVTHTCAHLHLSTAAEKALHQLMLSLRQPLSKDQVDSYAEGNLRIKTMKFSGHRQLKGTSALIEVSECIKHKCAVQQATFVEITAHPGAVDFLCPKGHARSAYDQFDPHNVRKSAWCSKFAGCHASTSWQCPCGRAWHNCPDHFGVP